MKMIKLLLLILIGLNIFDTISTIILLQNGMTELNPILRYFIEKYGLITIPLIKIPPLALLIYARKEIYKIKYPKYLLIFAVLYYTVWMLSTNLPLLIVILFNS